MTPRTFPQVEDTVA